MAGDFDLPAFWTADIHVASIILLSSLQWPVSFPGHKEKQPGKFCKFKLLLPQPAVRKLATERDKLSITSTVTHKR